MNDRDELRKLLTEWDMLQGGGGGIHNWRCEHPDRYGECGHVDEFISDILNSDWLRNRDVQKWKEGRASGFYDWGDMWADDAAPTPNPYRKQNSGELVFKIVIQDTARPGHKWVKFTHSAHEADEARTAGHEVSEVK